MARELSRHLPPTSIVTSKQIYYSSNSMAPKKKSGKASKGGRSSGGIIDGVPMTEMPREHLEKYTLRIRDELEREREERNFFQLERDKIRTFWEITRQQQEENKSELRNKDRALEEAEEKHQNELKEFNEKVKHLMYEHQCHLTEVKAENMISLRMAQEEHQNQEAILVEEKEVLRKQIVDEQLSHEEKLREIYLKHTEEVYSIREEFAEKIKEMAIKAEQRVEKIRKHFTLKNKMEIAASEEGKSVMINKLDFNHKEALSQLKSYYKGVIENNTSLIDSLKEEMANIVNENEELTKSINRLTHENKTLVKPLEETQQRVLELEKELALSKKDKLSLNNIHKRYAQVYNELQATVLERDALQIQLEKIQDEMEGMTRTYTNALAEIQKQNGVQVKILDKRIVNLEEEIEKREISMAQIFAEANVEPNAVREANIKLQAIITKYTKRIEMLQMELGRVVKAHDDMIKDFKRKAAAYVIPMDDFPYELYRPKLRQFLTEYSQQFE